MDEQRLERALRRGPPFATTSVARPLALDDPAGSRRAAGTGRLVLLVAEAKVASEVEQRRAVGIVNVDDHRGIDGMRVRLGRDGHDRLQARHIQ